MTRNWFATATSLAFCRVTLPKAPRSTATTATDQGGFVNRAFYGYDGNGNVSLLTDASGTEVARYRYDAFGQTLEAIGTKAADNPYRFSTKQ